MRKTDDLVHKRDDNIAAPFIQPESSILRGVSAPMAKLLVSTRSENVVVCAQRGADLLSHSRVSEGTAVQHVEYLSAIRVPTPDL